MHFVNQKWVAPAEAPASARAVEDTCNKGGGSVWGMDALLAVSEATRSRGLAFHLDGARAWNAFVVRGQWDDHAAMSAYGKLFDSMSLCFSKGLGCPVGSVLVGSHNFIAEAHRSRKAMGGGMRQAGILAAAGLHAFWLLCGCSVQLCAAMHNNGFAALCSKCGYLCAAKCVNTCRRYIS